MGTVGNESDSREGGSIAPEVATDQVREASWNYVCNSLPPGEGRKPERRKGDDKVIV
jgi:hypothetical protein